MKSRTLQKKKSTRATAVTARRLAAAHNNVLCVSNRRVAARFIRPNGDVRKGMIYRVLLVNKKTTGLVILGHPVFIEGETEECGWDPTRFRSVS